MAEMNISEDGAGGELEGLEMLVHAAVSLGGRLHTNVGERKWSRGLWRCREGEVDL